MVTPSPFRMDPPTYGGDLWQLQMMVFQALTRMTPDEEIGPGVADTWESNADASRLDLQPQPERQVLGRHADHRRRRDLDLELDLQSCRRNRRQPDTFERVVGYEEVKSGAAELLEGIEGDRRQHGRYSPPPP